MEKMEQDDKEIWGVVIRSSAQEEPHKKVTVSRDLNY